MINAKQIGFDLYLDFVGGGDGYTYYKALIQLFGGDPAYRALAKEIAEGWRDADKQYCLGYSSKRMIKLEEEVV